MKLFKSTTGRQDILVAIELSQSDLENKLWNWLEEKHNEIFIDIEMHNGGSIVIDEDEIIFIGDNGTITLEVAETETI